MPPRKKPRPIRFRIALAGNLSATIDVPGSLINDLHAAMSSRPSNRRRTARSTITQRHLIPRLIAQGALRQISDRLHWVDGQPGQFPVIISIEAAGKIVARRHGITAEGVLSCHCPNRCQIPGHDQVIY